MQKPSLLHLKLTVVKNYTCIIVKHVRFFDESEVGNESVEVGKESANFSVSVTSKPYATA